MKKIINRDILIEWGVLTIISFLLYDIIWVSTIGNCEFTKIWEDSKYLLADLVYCACLSCTIIWASIHIARLKYFSHISYRRQLLLSVTILISNVLLSVLLEYIHDLFIYSPYDSFEEGLLVLCLISMLSTLAHSAQYYSKMISRQSEQIIDTQKKMLKMQLDPHFIFNSLNILVGIIHTNPDEAENFTIRLSRIYRYIIKSIDHDTVCITNAINFAYDYVALLDIRFPNKIDFLIDPSISRNPNEFIPIMSLQLLIENAVKHNMPDEDSKLTIKILRKDDNLIVRNSINKTENVGFKDSFGLGLKNLYERYSLLGERRPQINGSENFYEVEMPIIHKK